MVVLRLEVDTYLDCSCNAVIVTGNMLVIVPESAAWLALESTNKSRAGQGWHAGVSHSDIHVHDSAL